MPTEIVAAIGEGALAYRERHFTGRWQSILRVPAVSLSLSEDSVVVEFADGPHRDAVLSLSFRGRIPGWKRVASMPAETTTYHATWPGFWGRRP